MRIKEAAGAASFGCGPLGARVVRREGMRIKEAAGAAFFVFIL
ncbi:MAG: hypothetical protein Q4D16_04490 [Eubacteriales bacterium]|nr:hypothetical protein [Eubacteriales bacterium]